MKSEASIMRYVVRTIAVIGVILAGPVWGQQVRRTFVSGKGADTGNCSVITPCRSFQYALSQTQSGGEVIALDTAGYGAVSIQSAATITVPAGIIAIATPAVAGQNAVYVGNAVPFRLEGLTLDGALYVDSVPANTTSTGSIVRCTIRSGGAQLLNGGTYDLVDTSITGGLTMSVVRSFWYNATLLRTTVSGPTVFGNSANGLNTGQMRVFDSFLGHLSFAGGTEGSLLRMVRTSAGQITLLQSTTAYFTSSSLNKLTIQTPAVANSFGNNDIGSVVGTLQTIPLR